MQLASRAARAGRAGRGARRSLGRGARRAGAATSPTRCTTSATSCTRRSAATPTARSTTRCSAPTTRTSRRHPASTLWLLAKLARGLTAYRANATLAIAWYWHFVNVADARRHRDAALGARYDAPPARRAAVGRPARSAPPSGRAAFVAGYGLTEAECGAGGARWGIANDLWQGVADGVGAASACVARRGARRSPCSRGRAASSYERRRRRSARIRFFATAALVANVLFLMIMLLDGHRRDRQRRVPPGMSAQRAPRRRVARPRRSRAASPPRRAAPPRRRPTSRGSTSTASYCTPATARTAAAASPPHGRSAPGRCATRPAARASARRCAASARSRPTSTSAPATCRCRSIGLQPRRTRVAARRDADPALIAYVASLGAGPADPDAASRRGATSRRGMHLFSRPLRRLPPDRRRGRLRDGRACRRRSRTRLAVADRRGGADRPVRHAALLAEGDLRRAARLDHRLRPVRASTPTTAAAGRSATSARCRRGSSRGSSRSPRCVGVCVVIGSEAARREG